MSEKINESLKAHFKAHRLVFWYDPEGSERELFDDFAESGTEKIELANDELAVKYRIARLQPDSRFLVYAPYPRPSAADNWLLDLEMGNFVFSTDKAAIIVQQLGVSPSLQDAIGARLNFFRGQTERVEPLAELATPEWTEADLLFSMLAVACARTKKEREKQLSLEAILLSLTVDEGREERWRHIQEWRLDGIFFERVEQEYKIVLDVPEPAGILLRLFTGAFAFQRGVDRTAQARRAFLFIEGWREQRSETERYDTTAREMERTTRAPECCADLSNDVLVKIDIYPCVDRELLSRLSTMIASASGDLPSALALSKARSVSYWCMNGQEGFISNCYKTIESACLLEQSLAELRVGSPFRTLSKQDLWRSYTERLYLVDRHYRRILLNARLAGSPANLVPVLERAAKTYLNDFLSRLAERWQSLLDTDGSLNFATRQDAFFDSHAARFLREGKRLFVIISDAFRWEAGCELAERLEATGRFKASCEPMIAVLPTYTSHGMAALLPHESIDIDISTGEVSVDGVLPAGTEGRSKHLARSVSARFPGSRACALTCEEFLSLAQNQAEDRLREMNLVYLYSAKIDTAGHVSDQGLPEAVDAELDGLVRILTRISAMGRANILVTADHGFLYSGSARSDEYMLETPALPGETLRDQRFILGTSLPDTPGLMRLDASETTFKEQKTALIAKGLTKLRRKGASGNFIHGGASLQELAVPVIRITSLKKNESRLAPLSIMGTKEITTPSIVVKIFQEEPVGGSIIPHRVRCWFETEAGEVISNKAECLCDSSDHEDVNRAFPLSLEFLPSARKHRGKKVMLQIQTVADGGTLLPLEPVEYKLRQIALDIDFF